MSDLDQRRKLIKQASLAAGKIIKTAEPTLGLVHKEGRGNFVTAADLACEKIIIDLIAQHFPSDKILSEETESDIQDILAVDHLWVIDPIDGTNNFRFGRNYSCVSIGYVEKGEVVLGAVYNPYVDELFFAEKGGGAYVNDKKLAVGTQQDIHEGVVGTDNSYFPEIGKKHLTILMAVQPTPLIMMKGSAALAICEIAAGRTDLYFHTGIHPWDCAAGFLIVREAGGVIKNFQGQTVTFTSPKIIVGNQTLVDKLIAIVAQENLIHQI